MSEHGRIMCAVDLSWRSEGAFNYAVALAKSRHAPLDLVFAASPRFPSAGEHASASRSLPNSVGARPRPTST